MLYTWNSYNIINQCHLNKKKFFKPLYKDINGKMLSLFFEKTNKQTEL